MIPLQHKDDVFVTSNQEGIDRVLNRKGLFDAEYAFMMESTVSMLWMMSNSMIKIKMDLVLAPAATRYHQLYE